MKKKDSAFDVVKDLFKNKKFQWAVTIILLLAILISSVNIRLSNVPLLKDATSGEYTSNDLDSLYFYRIAETKMANNGVLPAIDVLRSPGYNITWSHEILPDVLIGLFNIEKVFSSSITFDYSATISAPIIYGLLLIAFFFLTLLLTHSKIASIVSSALLAFAPAFLFRSIAGFYDHDHLGVLAVILLVIVLVFSLKRFEKNWKETAIWGLVLGFFTTLVLVSWGGAITFVLVALPVATFFYYLLVNKKPEKFLGFYLLWLISSSIFPIFFGYPFDAMISKFLDSAGLAALFVFGFSFVDFILIRYKDKLHFVKEKYEKLYSLGVTVILGIVALIIVGKNPITLAKKAWALLIYPFFGDFTGGRVGATVAENSQPFLTELISQNGQIIFWLFLFGIIVLAIEFAKNLKEIKHKLLLTGSTILLFVAVLYSRYSSSSFLNGENFISQAFYFVGAITFFGSFLYVYSKEKFKLDVETIVLFALTLTAVINARAAIRSFFLITPFVCLLAGYFISNIYKNYKESKKKEKKIWLVALVIALLLVYSSIFVNFSPIQKDDNGKYTLTKNIGSYQIASQQASRIGPSAGAQWQEAMAWARNNTGGNDIFLHWWDYGYFVQTLANRPTVTDGGRAGGEHSDHFVGRYVLTTDKPESAYSFMKTWNASYFLIDPTDLGKYGAFSKIGSNDSWDRVSTGVSSGTSDSKNNQETSKGVTRIYNINTCVDEDIVYNNQFIPGIEVNAQQVMSCKAYLGAVIIEQALTNTSVKFEQPTGVFFYNNKRYDIPIKNLYFNGQMVSFASGIDAVVYVIPNVLQTSEGKVGVDSTGAMMYLSPRVKRSLVGRLYVLGDYYNEYSGLKEAYTAQDPAVNYFAQLFGTNLGEFIYYQGLRAPLKIWEVNYPADTKEYKEFLAPTNSFGGMDYLF